MSSLQLPMAPLKTRIDGALEPLKPPAASLLGRLLRASGRDVTDDSTRRSCLVLAPHPDDETLGCAVTMMRRIEAGSAVHVLVASDGGKWPPSRDAADNVETRRSGARNKPAASWASIRPGSPTSGFRTADWRPESRSWPTRSPTPSSGCVRTTSSPRASTTPTATMPHSDERRCEQRARPARACSSTPSGNGSGPGPSYGPGGRRDDPRRFAPKASSTAKWPPSASSRRNWRLRRSEQPCLPIRDSRSTSWRSSASHGRSCSR